MWPYLQGFTLHLKMHVVGTGNSKTPMPVFTLSSAALSRGCDSDGDQDGARGPRTAIASGQADGLTITQHEIRHGFTECALLVDQSAIRLRNLFLCWQTSDACSLCRH